jgi:far upstream element-binding protein
MQNNSTAFQDAVARAKQIAQKLSAAAPNAGGLGATLKRSNNDDDPSGKRPAFSTSSIETASPVLRAQLIAQQINSQLGVKPTADSLPLSNQLTSQEDYPIPDKFVGLIIGKGGEQITRLQAESGCKVQISPLRQDSNSGGPNPPDRIANLSGSREAIDRARKIMDDIISRGRMAEAGANPYSMGSSKAIEVLLPSAKCGLIIGKGGENIRRIMDEYSVKLFVGQETIDIDGIEHKPLKISGDADKAEVCLTTIVDKTKKTKNGWNFLFSVLDNTFSINFHVRDPIQLRHVRLLLLLLQINRPVRLTTITVHEYVERFFFFTKSSFVRLFFSE